MTPENFIPKHICSEKCWKIDFTDGTYENTCQLCGYEFLGNKHRRICKECSDKPKSDNNIGYIGGGQMGYI